MKKVRCNTAVDKRKWEPATLIRGAVSSEADVREVAHFL